MRIPKWLAMLGLLIGGAGALSTTAYGTDMKMDMKMDKGMAMKTAPRTATAILAGGCFWCVQTDMEKLPGVVKTVAGYTGGTIPHPTYQNYHHPEMGQTSHVEAVQVTYDPAQVSYEALLDYFFRHIDPTDGGGQFCDRGAAYRPVIFVADEAQRQTATMKRDDVAKLLKKDIKVEILPATKFWAAEDYHQDYHTKNPVRYKFYRWNCGRDQRVKEVWHGVKGGATMPAGKP